MTVFFTLLDPGIAFYVAGLFEGQPVPPCLDAADFDDSGVLDVNGPLVLLRFMFLGQAPPPDPGPPPLDCGPDPTPDDLVDPCLPRGCNGF